MKFFTRSKAHWSSKASARGESELPRVAYIWVLLLPRLPGL
jgi:hypothetical protein